MRWGLATGALAVIAVAAVVLGVVALHDHSTDGVTIHHLEAEVRELTNRTGGADATVTSRVSNLESKVGALEAKAVVYSHADATVSSFVNCVPELQNELGGLEIKGETYAASYITNRTNISKACQALLYGTSG